MAQYLTPNARNVTAKGQPSGNECWLTAYEMLLNSGGESGANKSSIRQRLISGGFDVDTSIDEGLLDDDFMKMSRIMNTGTLLPSQLYTPGGLLNKLQDFGVLWLALNIPKNVNLSENLTRENYKKLIEIKEKDKWHHVVVVLGVDTERNQVAIINPWKQNSMDDPILAWWNWGRFVTALIGTEGLSGGCQYHRHTAARTYDER
jgi:hypothetical protein